MQKHVLVISKVLDDTYTVTSTCIEDNVLNVRNDEAGIYCLIFLKLSDKSIIKDITSGLNKNKT